MSWCVNYGFGFLVCFYFVVLFFYLFCYFVIFILARPVGRARFSLIWFLLVFCMEVEYFAWYLCFGL